MTGLMVTDDAILEVSRWSRELRVNAIKVVARERGACIWGRPFLVQPKSWKAFRRQARETRQRVEYARIIDGGEYEAVL